MTQKMPLVSVCIPVYNTKKYIVETIHSVVAQGYPNLEIIVQDNASNDGTWQIVQELASKYREMSIERNDHNVGMAPNWNLAINRAKGDYVMLLSADDLLEPGFIRHCLESFSIHRVDVVTTNHYILRQHSKIIRDLPVSEQVYKFFTSLILLRNPFSINFTIFTKDTVNNLRRNGDFFSSTFYTCDYDLWFRLGFSGRTIYYIDKPLATYRMHETNLSNNENKMWRQAVLVVLRHSRKLKKYSWAAYKFTLTRFMWRLIKNYVKNRTFDRRLFRVLYKELWR